MIRSFGRGVARSMREVGSVAARVRSRRLIGVGLVGVAVAGCGGSGSAPNGIAVKVGGAPITEAVVDHWMSILAPNRVVPDPPSYTACIAHKQALASAVAQTTSGQTAGDLKNVCRQQYEDVRRQAIGFLIVSRWLLGEADERGVGVTRQEGARLLENEVRKSSPGGEREFREVLKATGETITDAKLKLERELASARLTRLATDNEPTITHAQVAAYYEHHRRSFAVAESRVVEITNRKSPAEADQIRREVEMGRKFAGMAVLTSYVRYRDLTGGNNKDVREHAALLKAVFSAKPDVLTGPIRLRLDYEMFEVTRIAPAGYEPLRHAEKAIKERLAAEQRRAALAAFVRAWRRKWIAKTDCHSGFVVPKCRQYAVTDAAPEAPYSLN